MMGFATMLVGAAIEAGMKVPDDPDTYADEGVRENYKRFCIFCAMQLGQPQPYPGVHFENAKVIAKIPEEELETITYEDIIEMGFEIGYR